MVVAIVSILAVLALVGYRKLILASHTTEAVHVVESIRVAQETFHAEYQSYVSTSADCITLTSLFPTTAPTSEKVPWINPTPDPKCTQIPLTPGPTCFGLLNVRTDGFVAYGYATLGGKAGKVTTDSIALPNPSQTITSASTSSTDWYWITATGNLQGNPNPVGPYSYVVSTSLVNDLVVIDQ